MEQINLKKEIDSNTMLSHSILEFAKDESISELTKSKDWDLEKANVEIKINNVIVSSITFNDIFERFFEHFQDEVNELMKPEQDRIKEEAKKIIEKRFGTLMDTMQDVENDLDSFIELMYK